MTSDIEVSPGVVSSMRLGVRTARRCCVALIGSACALSAGMLALERYQLVPVIVAMIGAGPTLLALALGAKALQARAEEMGGGPATGV